MSRISAAAIAYLRGKFSHTTVGAAGQLYLLAEWMPSHLRLGLLAWRDQTGTMLMAETVIEMPVGVVVERRKSDHPWQDYAWQPVSVVPGMGEGVSWVPMQKTATTVQYLAGAITVELHRKETEAYLVNLADAPPRIYVVLTEAEDDKAKTADGEPVEWTLFKATLSPYEAQDYLDSGEDIVEAVPLPEAMIAWVQSFIDRHHVETPFKKRKRKPHMDGEGEFGKPTPLELRQAARRAERVRNPTPCRDRRDEH